MLKEKSASFSVEQGVATTYNPWYMCRRVTVHVYVYQTACNHSSGNIISTLKIRYVGAYLFSVFNVWSMENNN